MERRSQVDLRKEMNVIFLLVDKTSVQVHYLLNIQLNQQGKIYNPKPRPIKEIFSTSHTQSFCSYGFNSLTRNMRSNEFGAVEVPGFLVAPS